MNTKEKGRLRRAKKARAKIKRLGVNRLCINKSLNHTYAQLISPCGSKVLAAASTVEKTVREQIKHGGNQIAAKIVGKLIAERSLAAGVKTVAFDRAGYRYHGRVKALADSAREGGLDF